MELRVYYEDTDCGNVVYYANYLRYMERSRTEYMRERGVDLVHWLKRGTMFMVVEARVKYRAPARYNDLLDVESTVTEITSASITFSTTIYRHKGPLLVEGMVRIACTDADGHVKRIPGEIQSVLE
ncbi:MAG: YbgC/FadM family acyl-CoA thioesterase [Chitinispirillaceae bacterium]|nr:YbgC/FadM family acyl-CoA thioesterase [Chitinispirillaceae bacterium]